MTPFTLWIAAGLVLLALEMLTGTLYLLVLAFAAFAGSIVAGMGGNWTLQAIVVAIIAILGSLLVTRFRKKGGSPGSNLEKGQIVSVVAILSAGRVRVKYRGAEWDAQLPVGHAEVKIGTDLQISSMVGNTLMVQPLP